MSDAPLRRALGWTRAPILVVAIAASMLFFIPFLVVVATSWTSGAFLLFPPTGFSLQWYEKVLGDAEWRDAFGLSLAVSSGATLIALVTATFAAFALTRIRRRGVVRILRTLFIVPMALPPVAYAVGLLTVNQELPFLHRSLAALVIGEALIAFPYVFVLVSSALAGSDSSLRPAASTLGASWPMILLRVELPLVLPAILGGAIFAFAIVFDEVVLSVFLMPPGVETLPLKMFGASQEAFSPELTAASTLVSLLAIVVLGLAQFVILRRSRRLRAPRPRKVTA